MSRARLGVVLVTFVYENSRGNSQKLFVAIASIEFKDWKYIQRNSRRLNSGKKSHPHVADRLAQILFNFGQIW